MKNEIENIVSWIREYWKSVGYRKFILGLSGGVDSAVNAALAVKAIGRENVFGAIMPINSDPLDRIDAMRVVEQLGIEFTVDDLSDFFDGYIKRYPKFNEALLTQANIKSRLRALHLRAYANYKRGVVVGTSNRSELAVGYITKGGDGDVDFEPLAMYYKYEVYEIAKILNTAQEITSREPSAGLWDDQTDEKELGMSYEDLDYILERLDNDGAGVFNKEKLHRVLHLMDAAEHKQKMPPFYDRSKK